MTIPQWDELLDQRPHVGAAQGWARPLGKTSWLGTTTCGECSSRCLPGDFLCPECRYERATEARWHIGQGHAPVRVLSSYDGYSYVLDIDDHLYRVESQYITVVDESSPPG
jgi:hypothetical protein